ncbi:MAG TPA: DegT/DnrJ/EryC1/StrS aminotransferase family protein [Gemmatimonadaceae bacterium]|nr:DegT/DnrJ/EryC1/StrS aminotransferase family protein [Gemmatimonadaceae bacterium]
MMPSSLAGVVRNSYLPYALPSIGEEEIAEVVDSLRSGWITLGPKVKRFETAFAEYVGAPHAVAVNSCTAGLQIALHAFGIGPGDEVIVPTITFCATANTVELMGARPVLVDVGGDLNIDPEAVEAAITPRTRAIMPVHYGGQSCDLSRIYAIAARHGLAVIEDAAHAVGSRYQGRLIGAAFDDRWPRPKARATVFSFYATKNLATGEGGMITVDDDALADRCRRLALHGMSRDAWQRYTGAGSWYYEVIEPGYKQNMTDIQASLGIHQLRRLDEFTRVRQHYADLYDRTLADLPEMILPVRQDDRNHTFHLYAVRFVKGRLTIGRDQVIEELAHCNIGASVHFIPVHMHPYYRDRYAYKRDDIPNAASIFDELVSLPLYPGMSEDDVASVCRAVRAIVEHHRPEGE